MRVLLSVPISVSGKIKTENFNEDTRTLVVNAHGALMSLAAEVTAGQTLTISNKTSRQSRECRLIYVGSTQAGKSQVGLEFLEPSPGFWQIDFPPDDWVVPES
jgi:carbon monoxide dehydrogenase subunit G